MQNKLLLNLPEGVSFANKLPEMASQQRRAWEQFVHAAFNLLEKFSVGQGYIAFGSNHVRTERER